MAPELEPQARHWQIQRKMKESFGPTYLTAVSVIQGVALADLATVVAGAYREFTPIHWSLVGITFLALILIWNAYTNLSTLWSWLPDFRDAAIPFVTGALELFLNHAIVLSLSAWLVGVALLSGMAVLANWYSARRAREDPENAELLSLIERKSYRFQIAYNFGFSVLLLLLAALCRAGGLEASAGLDTRRGALALLVVLFIAAGLVTFIFSSIRTWDEIVAYARTGRMPDSRPGASEDQP